MPFTLVHPVFVVPIYNRMKAYCIPIALIAGSIVPDYDIIFRFTETRHHIFRFDVVTVLAVLLPLSLLSVFFYAYIMRDFMIEKCPPLLRHIGQNIPVFDIKNTKKNYLLLLVNILLSIYFHIFLDLISHYDAWTIMEIVKYKISDYEPLLKATYWGSIYLPQLFFLLLGLYIMYSNFHDYLAYFNWRDFVEKRILGYYLLVLIIAVCKISLSGLHAEFGIDVIVISFFCGFTLAFAIVASLHKLRMIAS